jgi:hypothetical protein
MGERREPLTAEAIARDKWNAVDLPLPLWPSKALLAQAYRAAATCCIEAHTACDYEHQGGPEVEAALKAPRFAGYDDISQLKADHANAVTRLEAIRARGYDRDKREAREIAIALHDRPAPGQQRDKTSPPLDGIGIDIVAGEITPGKSDTRDDPLRDHGRPSPVQTSDTGAETAKPQEQFAAAAIPPDGGAPQPQRPEKGLTRTVFIGQGIGGAELMEIIHSPPDVPPSRSPDPGNDPGPGPGPAPNMRKGSIFEDPEARAAYDAGRKTTDRHEAQQMAAEDRVSPTASGDPALDAKRTAALEKLQALKAEHGDRAEGQERSKGAEPSRGAFRSFGR